MSGFNINLPKIKKENTYLGGNSSQNNRSDYITMKDKNGNDVKFLRAKRTDSKIN